MDISSTAVCAICLDPMEADIYSLPECTHKYHTNCIMHWFRAGHNKCPLCNNVGVNGDVDLFWGYREAALENYKKMRRLSRKKNAPPELVKQIRILKKKEASNKKKKEKYKKFKQEVPKDGKTRVQLHNEWLKARRKWDSWRGKREEVQMKVLIGIQYIKPIIIAQKVKL